MESGRQRDLKLVFGHPNSPIMFREKFPGLFSAWLEPDIIFRQGPEKVLS